MGYFQHAISSRSVGSFVFCVDVWTCGLVGGWWPWWLIMRKFSADKWHVLACHLLTWTLFGRPVLPIHPPFLKRVSFFAVGECLLPRGWDVGNERSSRKQ